MEIQGYRLHEVVGDGRTGRVYRAERLSDGMPLAFRQVRPALLKESGVSDALLKLKADCAGLRNLVLVPVADSFSVQNAVCIVEPWIDGRRLKERMQDGAMPPEEVAALAIELLEGLAELHKKGLVHGDIHPGNIWLTSRGARLGSFGVAARAQRRKGGSNALPEPYDAPELQAGNQPPSVSTDMYGLAVSLHQALSGERSWKDMPHAVDPLSAALLRAQSPARDMRYANAEAFRDAVLAVQKGWEAPPEPEQEAPPPQLDFEPKRAPKPMPGWVRTAALGAVGALLLFGLLRLLWSLLPDVPEGMLEVPAGGARMGDAAGTRDERPGFEASWPRFFIDIAEVTVEDYAACVQAGQCTPVGTRLGKPQDAPREPVVGVTWLQANGYCTWKDKRLPSENEWEGAARHFGGAFPWGDEEPNCLRAVFGLWEGGECMADEAGTLRALPTAEELEEMEADEPLHLAGNVWEYTDSDYKPSRNPSTGGRAAPGSSAIKVIKGGAWTAGRQDLRSAARLGVPTDHWANDVGFRCAREAGD
jgi:formylglycine-generating enzyme required for sulfatase activity